MANLQKQIRHLKIEQFTRLNQWSTTHTSRLLLQGNWLKDAGFAPGLQAKVKIFKNLVTVQTQETDFNTLLDSIYYEGCAEQLSSENPEQYNQLFNDYKKYAS